MSMTVDGFRALIGDRIVAARYDATPATESVIRNCVEDLYVLNEYEAAMRQAQEGGNAHETTFALLTASVMVLMVESIARRYGVEVR